VRAALARRPGSARESNGLRRHPDCIVTCYSPGVKSILHKLPVAGEKPVVLPVDRRREPRHPPAQQPSTDSGRGSFALPLVEGGLVVGAAPVAARGISGRPQSCGRPQRASPTDPMKPSVRVCCFGGLPPKQSQQSCSGKPSVRVCCCFGGLPPKQSQQSCSGKPSVRVCCFGGLPPKQSQQSCSGSRLPKQQRHRFVFRPQINP